jgi:hypothetical protein
MATRRIKSTVNNKYVQPLKLKTGRKLVITPNSDYNSIVFTTKHRATTPRDYILNLWAKFAQVDFDGIHIKSYLDKDSDIMQAANYTFSVYLISTTDNWAETFVITKPGSSIGDGSVKCHVTAADFPSTVDLDGELTLAIVANCTRQGRKYRKKIYVNHLGVYDSIVRLRNDVEYLDITKLDE